MLERILADASTLSALFDADDAAHESAIEFLRSRPCRLVAPYSSVAAAIDRLSFSPEAQTDFLEWSLEGGVLIEQVSAEELLFHAKKRSRPQKGFALTSLELEIVAKRTGIKTIITVALTSGGIRTIAAQRISNAPVKGKPK